jgi:hypothetical protein
MSEVASECAAMACSTPDKTLDIDAVPGTRK